MSLVLVRRCACAAVDAIPEKWDVTVEHGTGDRKITCVASLLVDGSDLVVKMSELEQVIGCANSG